MKILLMFIFSSLAFSQDFVFDKEKGRAVPSYIGQIKLMKGKVFKKNAEGTTEVETGERFKKDDVLITNNSSFAKIQIVDDTIISVGPETEFKFDEMDFKEKTDRKLSFTLSKGQVSGEVKNKARPQDIKFRTRYTSMGVRGTYFLMNHQIKGSLNIAEYALLRGKIEVSDDKKASTSLNEGDRVVLIHDSAKNISKNDKMILSPEEMKELKGEGIDEETELRPFLPYFTATEIGPDSPLYSLLHTTTKKEAGVEQSNQKREEPKPHYEETLKELNKKLRENQKRR